VRKLSYREIFDQRPTLAQMENIGRMPFYCLAENIRSLYNVGSIFRTSDAVLLKCLYLTGYTGYPPRKEIDKTALGAVDSVGWKRIEDPVSAARQIKKKNIQLVALEHTSESVAYTEYKFEYPFCLIIGNEVDGISESLLDQAEASIEIPMFGLKQSLNVSVAYGVVMFHALHDYLSKNKVE
jgi:tRNA G18 (ribose-2'-O)-methylase SpoU